MAYVTHTIVGRSAEKSFTRHHLPTVTNANYATITGNTPVTQNVGSLRAALAAICLGNFVRHEVTAFVERAPVLPPASPYAQRELKVLIRCIDSAAKRFTIEIPAPRLDVIGQDGTDEVDETAVEWGNLVAELVNFRSPWGNTFTVTGGSIVGRSL